MRIAAIVLAAASLAGTGAAAQEDCAFDYATFESAVPHFDLEECPDAVEDAEGAFCRASIHMEILSVWVFDEEAMCFRRVQQFFEEDYEVVVRE